MPNLFSEDDIERTLLGRLHEQYGYQLLNCMTAQPGDLQDGSGRRDKCDVILGDIL